MPQLFDPKELLERVDNDWDFLAETVDMLGTDGRDLMREIQQAAARGDATTVGHAAHTMKGMISNFCAPAAQASASEVETIGKRGDLAAAAEAVKALDARLEELIGDLTALLGARP
jgi:HPt (histidine-containing phosphotransfer) domain-containing protein